MKYLLVAEGALVVGLLAAGSSLQSVLPFLLLLACPLMMVFMMRGMGGHGDSTTAHDHDDDAAPRRWAAPWHSTTFLPRRSANVR